MQGAGGISQPESETCQSVIFTEYLDIQQQKCNHFIQQKAIAEILRAYLVGQENQSGEVKY